MGLRTLVGVWANVPPILVVRLPVFRSGQRLISKYKNMSLAFVVVVYQCSISNVMYTGDIEALFVLVHALLDC